MSEFHLPNPYPNDPSPWGDITTGPDGALWFTGPLPGFIGRITTDGTVSEFAVRPRPHWITTGPDGALWFTHGTNRHDPDPTPDLIGRLTTEGTVREFVLPTLSAGVRRIPVGPDGALWFTKQSGNQIGRITVEGVVSEFAVPTPTSEPWGIASGSDGALWLTEERVSQIGRVTAAGSIIEFSLTVGSVPEDIVAGTDGSMWFTEIGGRRIGRIAVRGGQAGDGRRLLDESAETVARFCAVWGEDGADRWVVEHDAELALLAAGPPIPRIAPPTTSRLVPAGPQTSFPAAQGY